MPYGEKSTGTALVAKGLNRGMSGMQSVVRISHASLVYRLRQSSLPNLRPGYD